MKSASRESIQLPGGHSFRLLRWGKNLRDVELVLSPERAEPIKGQGSHWHYHAEMELTFFTSGEGTRFVGDDIGFFRAGDLVLLGEQLPHYWHTLGPSSGLSIQWHFPENHAFWNLPETLPLNGLFRKASRGIHFSPGVAAQAGLKMESIARIGGIDRLGRFLELLAFLEVQSAWEQSFLSTRPFALSHTSAHRGRMAEALRFLTANFRSDIRLDDLLRLTGLSKATFARQFKKHAGKSYRECLGQIRLEGACRDLRETDRAILDIALSNGFGQLSFFNRLFRRRYRCSPRQYRQRMRKKACVPRNTTG